MKFEEAEPLLLAGYEGLKKHKKDIPKNAIIRIPEAVQRLVNLYTAWEKSGEAARWKKVLEQASLETGKK